MLKAGIEELDDAMNKMIFMEGVKEILMAVAVIFSLWCLCFYVSSRRSWFEEDIRIRSAKKSYDLARAEQVRLELLALKDGLKKNGINPE